jgi:predicted alpha/beta hydrolase family esterase
MRNNDASTHVGMTRRAVCLAGATALMSALSAKGFAEPGPEPAEARRARVYIIHGYMATPTAHWFPWLRQRLSTDGVEAAVLSMPAPDLPDPAAWAEHIDTHVVRPDENTFFVAHSLGCLALLNYLAHVPTGRIGGVVLVSGFREPLPGLPQLDGFVAHAERLDPIRDLAPRRSVIAARDDTIVPYVLSQHLAANIDAEFVTVEKGGHFLASDGFVEFPLVYEKLAAHMRNRA